MALRKKGARRIVVDATTYRWRLRGRPTYSQALAASPCTYAVEHAEYPGATLVVATGHAHPSNWVSARSVPVRPAHVAESIRMALAQGWQPIAPGSPFLLNRAENFIPF
ncbi:hypothetical protein NONI108955_28365 [Nocardia ninae]|uniref:Uncharacterized protein n=1 Tax=Nocardia ninae NBRC 108245 TaxID=1210091 RepID=A0A511MVL5_9NOCA|nr:hypothetical protein [Nocardia ninae]GEM44146.1 hypothetical protein NN4_86650 [Nocardia ninae NBRC 108245]